MITKEDLAYFHEIKKNTVLIQHQLISLKSKEARLLVQKPATLGNGIHEFPLDQQDHYRNYFDQHGSQISAIKFVPASGLASRMFYFLRDFLLNFDPDQDDFETYLANESNHEFCYFIQHIEKFSFYDLIKNKVIEEGQTHKNHAAFIYNFIQVLLDDAALGMEGKAKALLPLYSNSKAAYDSAFELQIIEALQLFSGITKTKVHFTIDADQLPHFIALENKLSEKLSKVDSERLQIEYSFQDSKTDSIALLNNKTILRDIEGKIEFRKSGHGALIDNIQRFKTDLVFIKTVDNVKPNDRGSVNVQKAMGGLYLERFNQIKSLLNQLQNATATSINQSTDFIKSCFHIDLTSKLKGLDFEEQIQRLIDFFNRPLRVCGMITNEGKPGGGPFWIEQNGETALQIVESSELQASQGVLPDALFFNPVNMVCGLKDFEDNTWELDRYKDSGRSIISEKIQMGQPIKTFELPGLWNGSMGYWNSIFVEIPTATFRSLKTINDCLEQKKE
ncbi:MAG: hypothetical protein DA394_07800 [Candidatus Arcticimaribacter sp.]|nr:MAG: hypothetical protein DA394_07800 [Candidatus Arcticimaribacter sp.]